MDKLVYKVGLFWLNLYIALNLVIPATTFARTFTSSYSSNVRHSLMVLFTVGFFLVFRNLTLLAFSLREDKSEQIEKQLPVIALLSVVVLLIYMAVQVLPEFFLSTTSPLG